MVNESGSCESKVFRIENGDVEEDNFKLSNAALNQNYVQSFFSQCCSMQGQMLLVNRSSIYIKSQVTSEWHQNIIQFESNIVALYPVSANN